MYLLFLLGLSPGSVCYTSGVRGGLQRRTRRGPGRRRRQLQPDACRVLHHRLAGDFLSPTSPLPSFIPVQLLFYNSSHLISLEVSSVSWNGVNPGFILLSHPFHSHREKPHPGFQWSVAWYLLPKPPPSGLLQGKRTYNPKRAVCSESWNVCSIMRHKGKS